MIDVVAVVGVEVEAIEGKERQDDEKHFNGGKRKL